MRTRKPISKILALVLGLVMIFSLVAACAGDETPDPTQAPAGDTPTAAPSDGGDDPAPPPAANGPLSPMSERITLRVGMGYNPPEDPRTLPGVTPETQSFNQLALDLLNIEIEYIWAVPEEQHNDRFQLSVASGDIPDIMYLYSPQDFVDFAQAGMLRDMKGAYDAFALPEIKEMYDYFDGRAQRLVTIDGQMLAIPYAYDTFGASQILYYRNDWLTELGLDVPNSIDDMIEVARAFVDNDMGGDKTTGLGLYDDLYSWFHDTRGLFHGHGAYPTAWIEKGNELVFGTIQPETKDALDTMRSMYSDGLLDREFATMNMDQLVNDIVAGHVGLLYGEWWCYNWPLNNHMEAEPDVDWRATLIPSVAGGPGTTIVREHIVARWCTVSANAPEGAEEAMMKLINLAYDIQFSLDAKERYGDIIEPEAGYVYNWVPVYIHEASQQYNNFRALQEAVAIQSNENLWNREQQDLWTAYQVLYHGLEDEEWPRPRAWGMWESRGSAEGGMGLTTHIRENNLFILNKYYGDPTPTEVDRRSTLNDMWRVFMVNYIMGNVGEDAWDDFVSDWKALGGDDWTAEVNAQYAALN